MSAKAGKRPMRPLSTREKLEAIRRVHEGESKASVARDIGVPESTLRGWCKNEDKISLLSRQSSPETDESNEHHQDKKRKLEENVQPFNLSLKAATTSNGYSPNSENRYKVDYAKTLDAKAVPLDLKTKITKEPVQKTPSAASERERNRAELARLSVELGLNRPEMFLSNFANSNANININDMANLGMLGQWNPMFIAQVQQARKLASPGSTSNTPNTSGGSLLTTVNQLPGKQSPVRLPNEKLPLEESVRYWLNSSTPPSQSPNSSNNGYPTSLSTPLTNAGTATSPLSGMTPEQNAWFLKLYKTALLTQMNNTQYPMQFPAPVPDKPILYQQLTKDKEVYNAENLSINASLPEDRPGAKNIKNSKARAVLDTLLLNNNNISKNSNKDGEAISQDEAVVHGEKFLSWLESCSEPSVTTMQIMQFRSLLTNVKTSADRKNGGVQMKAKVRRK
ncbi:hypothetical protein HHI36_000158 [Cryptolaemus montrouzieri]|uniref:HTH psq-type domain-containing protein n=1 Tax=Cryptolaemus montrouzieri TaxID=559131 RepID=A0ABD2P4L1_9CUCU